MEWLAELQERWRAGERVPVEDYLRRSPHLAGDPDALLDLAYAEYLLRLELGERPAEEEYLRRFPAHGDGLRRQFDLHRALGAGSVRPPTAANGEPPSEVATRPPGTAAVGSETPTPPP